MGLVLMLFGMKLVLSMLFDLLFILLFFCIFSIVYYSNFVREGFGGIDIWRWMKYALEIKRIKGLPEEIDGYVVKAPFNYPPFFLYLLSLFSNKIIHRFPHLLQLIIWFVELIYVYLFLFSKNSQSAVWLTLVFFVVSVFRNFYFSSRSLANFLITVISSIFLLPTSFGGYLAFFITTLFLLYSHRHGVQYIAFLTFFYIWNSPIFFLIFWTAYGLNLWFSKFFKKVYLNHIGILSYHRKIIMSQPDSGLGFLWRNFKRVFISKLPYFVLFFFVLFFKLGDKWIGINFLYFIFLLTIVYSTKKFGFLGEPERNFDYMSLMVVSALIQLPLVQAVAFGCIFLLWDVLKWFYKRGRSLYDVNTRPPQCLDELILKRGNDRDVFFSFPPVFDDYVLYKYENVRVVFHDNGMALSRDPLAYGPNNSTLMDEDQLSYIINKYSVGIIVLFNRPEYKNYEILKNYRLEYLNENYLFFSL
jgi:hypothetical protein